MSLNFPERDWKHFRKIREAALERFCRGILDSVSEISKAPEGKAHETYLQLYKLIHQKDDELGHAFNDMRRSTALMQILIMNSKGLFTKEEIAGFTPEIQAYITEFR